MSAVQPVIFRTDKPFFESDAASKLNQLSWMVRVYASEMVVSQSYIDRMSEGEL